MKITVNNKSVELHFGVRFVRELNRVSGMEANGVSLGMGLTKTLPALEAGDPVALSNVIYAAAYEGYPQITQKDIDKYIENCESIEKLFSEVRHLAYSSNIVKPTVKAMEKSKK